MSTATKNKIDNYVFLYKPKEISLNPCFMRMAAYSKDFAMEWEKHMAAPVVYNPGLSNAFVNDRRSISEEQFFDFVRSLKRSGKYRTASKADSIAKMPDDYAIITNPSYAPALKTAYGTPGTDETAYLMQVRQDAELTFEDGIAYIFSKAASETDFKNYITHESVDSLDIPLLTSLFTVMYKNIGEDLKAIESEEALKKQLMNYGVDLYIPDFMEYRGVGRNYSNKQLESLLNNIAKFHNTIGMMEIRKHDKVWQDGYMLLLTSSIHGISINGSVMKRRP